MATYKTANNLPIMEEVSENTYALVEENGALKRVSGENLGGKSNCCVFTVDNRNVVADPLSIENTDNDGVIYTCNMTFTEFVEALMGKTLVGINLFTYNNNYINFENGGQIFDEGDYVTIEFNNISLDFASDDTITEHVAMVS